MRRTRVALSKMKLKGCLLIAACVASASAAQAPVVPANLNATLARIGDHVAQYYLRARSLVCIETVTLQPLQSTMSYEGFGRELVYELRIEWEPPADGDRPGEASVVRQLLKINGRAPRAKDTPGCLDPKPVSPEPLALLLPGRRDDYVFSLAGAGRTGGRASVMLDYKGLATRPPEIVWSDKCVTIDLPGRTRGRVWVDAATDDVLRVEEHLTEMFEFRVPGQHRRPGEADSWVVERADSTIQYRPVVFHDPDETMMLPASIQSLTIIRNAGVPRLRTTQTLSKYQRFTTKGRIVR